MLRDSPSPSAQFAAPTHGDWVPDLRRAKRGLSGMTGKLLQVNLAAIHACHSRASENLASVRLRAE